ncbi:SWIM zinc finger family protein [Streptomyces sp. NPDC046805]|uniref:SWIM zinc finger family protein n=1 Tax=Streptomyces sp. NPDC046805 TaxID=3155134 RepID=UPI0033F9D66D
MTGTDPGTAAHPAAEPGAEQRPGDAARRALRAASERADDAAARAEEPAAGEPRPADAARAALRLAASTRHRAGTDADGTPEADRGGRAAPQPAPAARPGDAAREALRAARKEGQGPRTGAAAPRAPRTTPRPEATASQEGAGTTAGGVDHRQVAREVREFLATAFRMPPTADAPDDDPAAGAHEGSDAGRGEGLVEGQAEGQVEGPLEVPDANAQARRTTSATGPAGAGRPAVPRRPAVPQRVAAVPTMATPDRDGELRRTFPAFPPRTSPGEGFAETWWGNAWVAALEQGALDVGRLARGHGYAERGHVDAISVTPGLVLAYVQGSRARPYRVQLRLRTFGDAEWERLLDAAAARPGHLAALLDKELPQSLADGGVPLLPGVGDLQPRCSCPDSGHPCKHAAALCYQTARLLDADPFLLLLLRGRGERDLLDTLSRRSAAEAARTARERQPASLPGVRASEVLAPRELPPLPAPLPIPRHPEQPPVYPAAPGGPDPFALDQLATDAAARAHALLGTGRDPVGELTLWQDAVRLAAARPGSGLTAATRALYSSLASAAGRTPAELARGVAAWRQGGLEGIAVLEEPWDPPAGRFDRARPLLLAAGLPAFRPWRNRLTHPRGHVQLRLGHDGLWYAYESEPDHDDWWPRGTPDLDPVGALTGLDAQDDTAGDM